MPRRIDRALDKVASCKISMSTRNAKRWVSLKNHLGYLADDKLMDYLLDLADSLIVRDENTNGNAVVESQETDDVQSRFVNDARILHANSQRRSSKESNADDSCRSAKLQDQHQESNKAHTPKLMAKLAKGTAKRHKRKSKCHKDKHKRNKHPKIKDTYISACAGNKLPNQSDSRKLCSDLTDENFENFSSILECDRATRAVTGRIRKKGRKSCHDVLESSEWINQSGSTCQDDEKEDEASRCGVVLTETCDENSKQESEQAYSADETAPVVSENKDENRTSIVESAIAVDIGKDFGQINMKASQAAIGSCKSPELQDAAYDFIETEHAIQDSITLENWLIKHKRNSRLAQVLTPNSVDPMSKGYGTDKSPETEQEIVQRRQDEMCSSDVTQREEEQERTHPDWPLFSRESLPVCLELKISNMDHGLGIFARNPVPMSTRFGPLVGTPVQEKDIPDDYSMKHIWEISIDNKTQYLSTTNPLASNWMRYLRPADTEEDKTVDIVKKKGQLFLVTSRTLIAGTELLYWFDSQSKSWTRKNRMDKTNCGGCNLKFSHPIYYRLHCCIFHDTNYSLTIRKYHCKVCGAAVLGKDNIMKHAAQFHAGRGAYQCQYCKKFFLRLNYLEMHRTYGCSKNPSRSRPLCDFCGRKFCQPQKLKVHIKRMHSDASDVLEEFQCKSCTKLLGSRAALQRHMKEVHHKDVVGAAACDRCGKTFQNKSNLKIHMLTHSGVKPFKCKENECKAAFTTKQCLQFHYKKVHGLSDEMMPKIERSIAYTFDAYSGGLVEDLGRAKTCKFTEDEQEDSIDNNLELEEENDSSSSVICNEAAAIVESSPSLEEEIAERETIESNKMELTESTVESSGIKLDSMQAEYPIPETFNIDDIPNSNKQSCDDKSPSRMSPNDEKLELACCKRQESYNASLLVEAALDAAERDIGVVSIPPLEDNEQAGNADFYSVPNELCFKSVDYQVAHEASVVSSVDSCFAPNPTRQPLSSISSQYRSTSFVNAVPNRLHSIEQYLEQEIPTPRYDDIVQFHSNHNSQIHPQSQLRSTLDSVSSDESDSAVQNLSLAIKDKSSQHIETSRYNYDYDSINKARVKFEPLIVQTAVAEQGLDMSARGIQQTCESQLQNTNHLHHYHHPHHLSYKMDENERQGVDLSISSPCVSSPSYATIYPPYSHVDVPRVVNLESSSHQLHTAVSRIITSPLPAEASALVPPDCAPQVRILPSSPIPSYNSTTWSLGTPHHTPRSGYHYCNYY